MDRFFVSDGCSGGLAAVWRLMLRRDPPWHECCVAHDLAYHSGGTRHQRRTADAKLLADVALRGHPLWAIVMWAAVRIGGHPLLPTPWRWGYGWHWPTGYPRAFDLRIGSDNSRSR